MNKLKYKTDIIDDSVYFHQTGGGYTKHFMTVEFSRDLAREQIEAVAKAIADAMSKLELPSILPDFKPGDAFLKKHGINVQVGDELRIKRDDGYITHFDVQGVDDSEILLWCNHGNWLATLDINLVFQVKHHRSEPKQIAVDSIEITKVYDRHGNDDQADCEDDDDQIPY